MKQKRILAAAGIVAGVGLLLVGVGVLLGSKDGFSQGAGSAREQTLTFDAAACALIETDLGEKELSIRGADVEEITVHYQTRDGESCTAELENGVLRVVCRDERAWYQRISIHFFDWGTSEDRVEIQVPEQLAVQLSLKCASGGVTLEGLTLNQDCRLESKSGDIAMKNCTWGGDVNCITGSGAVQAEQMNCVGAFVVSVASGDVAVSDLSASTLAATQASGSFRGENINCAETLELSHASGDTELDHVRARAASADAASGSLRAEDLDAEELVRVESVSGDVNLELADSIDAYTVTWETTSGDCNLPGGGGGGAKQLYVTTTSGGIDVTFAGN